MLIELVAQWINVAFFILPNATLLARPCEFFTKLVREKSLRTPTCQGAAMSKAQMVPLHLNSEARRLKENLNPCSPERPRHETVQW